MADLVLRLVAGDGSTVPVRYRDNGDGTYSMAVAFTGPGGSGTFEITDGTFILGTVAHPLQVSLASQLQYAQDSITAYGTAANGAPVTGLPVAVAGWDGVNVRIPLTATDGRLLSAPSAKRDAGVLHRNAIAVVDKLATPVAPTSSAVTEGGSTLPNSALWLAVAAGNRFGTTAATLAAASITPAANQALRATIAQVTNAEWYSVFLSVDAAPKLVARISEAQRASGGFIVSTVGTVTSGGGAGAGQVDLGVVGTGLQTSNAIFAQNLAYTPATVAGVGSVDCTGRSRAHVYVELAVADLRVAPALTIVPFFLNQVSGKWAAGASQTLSLLGGIGQTLIQDFEIDVDGATGLVVLVDTITGSSPTATVHVELA